MLYSNSLHNKQKNPRSKELPNKGKKVLMFSDSRQTAAKLARDMTLISDGDTGRQIITKAAKILYDHKSKKNEIITLDEIYGLFVKLVADNQLAFFYGEEKEKITDSVIRYNNRYKNKSLERLLRGFENSTNPALYKRQILQHLTDSFRALHDLVIGHMSINDKLIDDLEDLSDDIEVDIDSLKMIINA